MNSFGKRFGRSTASLAVSARWMVAIGSAVLATQAMATVVTPSDLQGWLLADGASGTSPAQITGARPDAGNGSLQFDINASNQQPLAYHALTAVRFGDLVNSNMSFGFDWLLPVGAPSNSSPTIRLLLSGLSGVAQPGGRTDGSLGWYANTLGSGVFVTSAFSMTSGEFFFRVGGVGQESNACTSTASSFDDRRQTLAQWAGTCTGAGGTANIDNAFVTGIEVDWGTFSTTIPQSSFADLINYSNIGSNNGSFNFEVRASAAAVPEPDTLALMVLGMGLAAGTVARTQRRRRAATAA